MPSFKKKARKIRYFVPTNQARYVTVANVTVAMATRDILLSTRIIIELDWVLIRMTSREQKNTTGHVALRRHCCSFLNEFGFQKEMNGCYQQRRANSGPWDHFTKRVRLTSAIQ